MSFPRQLLVGGLVGVWLLVFVALVGFQLHRSDMLHASEPIVETCVHHRITQHVQVVQQ